MVFLNEALCNETSMASSTIVTIEFKIKKHIYACMQVGIKNNDSCKSKLKCLNIKYFVINIYFVLFLKKLRVIMHIVF